MLWPLRPNGSRVTLTPREEELNEHPYPLCPGLNDRAAVRRDRPPARGGRRLAPRWARLPRLLRYRSEPSRQRDLGLAGAARRVRREADARALRGRDRPRRARGHRDPQHLSLIHI